MKKYYLSLHSKEGKEYKDATKLRAMLEGMGEERTNNPYEANKIIAFFYGDTKLETRGYALEMKLLELIHEKNPEAKIFVMGRVTELVDFSALYPFVTSRTKGKTLSDLAREPGWNGTTPVEVYDDFQRQVKEELMEAKIPKFLAQPESADAAEEVICSWIALDNAMNERGLKSKCNMEGYDEELSFSLAEFLTMIARNVMSARKGQLDLPLEMTECTRKLAKAYK